MTGTTHVANASPYNAWIQCDADRVITLEAWQKTSKSFSESNKNSEHNKNAGGFGVKGFTLHSENERKRLNEYSQSNSSSNESGYKQAVYYIASSCGFTPVKPGNILGFNTPGEHLQSLAYITIFLDGNGGDIYALATAFPIRCDESVIIGRDGQIHKQAYGKNCFIDVDGYDHNADAASCAVSGRRLIKSEHSTFLRASNWEAVSGSAPAEDSDKWYIEDHGGKVTFKAIKEPLRYLRAKDGARQLDLASHARRDEIWIPSKNTDGSWSFKSYFGTWLSILGDGTVCTMDHCRSSEHFWLEYV